MNEKEFHDVLEMISLRGVPRNVDLWPRISSKLNMFAPLSEPVRPFFSPPRLVWPPVQRIDLMELKRKVMKAWPQCEVVIPERFGKFEIRL